MGVFTRRIKPGYISNHHRRTAVFMVKVLPAQLDALDNAVTASRNWNGEELITNGKTTTVRLEYGPVKGAYESDLIRFFAQHDLMLADFKFTQAIHADSGCTHSDCGG